LSVVDQATYLSYDSTAINLSNITGSVIDYNDFGSNPYFFQADKQRDDGSKTCELKPAYVNSSVDTSVTFYATDPLTTWEIETTHDKNIPYLVTLEMVNGSSLPSFVSVDNSSFSTNRTVNITFDIPSIGTYYNVSDLYEFDIRVRRLFLLF